MPNPDGEPVAYAPTTAAKRRSKSRSKAKKARVSVTFNILEDAHFKVTGLMTHGGARNKSLRAHTGDSDDDDDEHEASPSQKTVKERIADYEKLTGPAASATERTDDPMPASTTVEMKAALPKKSDESEVKEDLHNIA